MSVAGPPRRSPSCRWRKRHRPGADWWGPPVRLIVDQGCGYLFTCFGFPFWLLFSGVWETLIFGTGDWFAFGESFFCGLFTPTYPLPGHRLVPESQKRCCHVSNRGAFPSLLTLLSLPFVAFRRPQLLSPRFADFLSGRELWFWAPAVACQQLVPRKGECQHSLSPCLVHWGSGVVKWVK